MINCREKERKNEIDRAIETGQWLDVLYQHQTLTIGKMKKIKTLVYLGYEEKR